MCDKAKICGCRKVVTRTYNELRARNIPDISALDTAVGIFSLHHAEVSEHDARIIVAKWLGENTGVSPILS